VGVGGGLGGVWVWFEGFLGGVGLGGGVWGGGGCIGWGV